MLERLKEQVCAANLELPASGLVCLTWGNVSALDRESGCVVIKPSGVDYTGMRPQEMCVVDLDGNPVEGELNPSSDLQTHLALYRAFDQVGAIVHTHSQFAVAWSQSCMDLPCYGTTHADCFYGPIPCTRPMTQEEIDGAYELQTGNVIVSTFRERGLDPLAMPAVLCSSHGPFAWGTDAKDAVHNAIVLEQVAKMALLTRMLRPDAAPAPRALIEKHYRRKHGANAYYGQPKKNGG